MALLGVCWGIGTILGPVIGGAFAGSSATWRWVSIVAKPNIQRSLTRLRHFISTSSFAESSLLFISFLSRL